MLLLRCWLLVPQTHEHIRHFISCSYRVLTLRVFVWLCVHVRVSGVERWPGKSRGSVTGYATITHLRNRLSDWLHISVAHAGVSAPHAAPSLPLYVEGLLQRKTNTRKHQCTHIHTRAAINVNESETPAQLNGGCSNSSLCDPWVTLHVETCSEEKTGNNLQERRQIMTKGVLGERGFTWVAAWLTSVSVLRMNKIRRRRRNNVLHLLTVSRCLRTGFLSSASTTH